MVQKILDYYLEYEIYNIANSSQIKPDSSNCYIMTGKIDINKTKQELNKLRLKKIKSVTEKFIGKRAKNKEELVKEIMQELDYLNSEQTNQLQVVSRIKSLIKEKIKSDYDAKCLIDKFNHAKENYEKYNLKEEFIKAKEDMLKNELIKEYVMIQNKINMLTLQINNRIGKITKKHY